MRADEGAVERKIRTRGCWVFTSFTSLVISRWTDFDWLTDWLDWFTDTHNNKIKPNKISIMFVFEHKHIFLEYLCICCSILYWRKNVWNFGTNVWSLFGLNIIVMVQKMMCSALSTKFKTTLKIVHDLAWVCWNGWFGDGGLNECRSFQMRACYHNLALWSRHF